MKFRFLTLIGAVIILLFLMNQKEVYATSTLGNGCEIKKFWISPDKTNFILNEQIQVYVESTCGTSQFYWDSRDHIFYELGTTNLSADINTKDIGPGSHSICVLSRGDGGWENANKQCIGIYIGANPPTITPRPTEPEPKGGDNCWVNSFSISPLSAKLGDKISFSGSGDCGDGGPRAVKFTVDGVSVSELGAPSLSGTWSSQNSYDGYHKICFLVVKGDWSGAASQCKKFTIGSGSVPEQDAEENLNCLSQLKLVKDVTIPDYTEIPTNQSFTKIWRVRNAGTCTWSTKFRFHFESGDRLGGNDISLPKNVNPGEEVDIKVNLKAPSQPGTYQGFWQVVDESGYAIKGRPFVIIVASGESQGNSNESDRMGLDVLNYCKSKGYSEAFANKIHDANSWICSKSGEQTFVDMNEVCQYQYSNAFIATVGNVTDPYSWGCKKVVQSPAATLIPTSTLVSQSDSINESWYDTSSLSCPWYFGKAIKLAMQTDNWKWLMERANHYDMRWVVCGMSYPNSINKAVKTIDFSIISENGKVDPNSGNMNLNIFSLITSNDSKRAVLLLHEMRHTISNYEDNAAWKTLANSSCSLENFQKLLDIAAMNEIKSFAFEDLAYGDDYDIYDTAQRAKIIKTHGIARNYISMWEKDFNKNNCGKKIKITYDEQNARFVASYQ